MKIKSSRKVSKTPMGVGHVYFLGGRLILGRGNYYVYAIWGEGVDLIILLFSCVSSLINLYCQAEFQFQSSRTEYSLNPDYFYPPPPLPGIVVMRHFQTSRRVKFDMEALFNQTMSTS